MATDTSDPTGARLEVASIATAALAEARSAGQVLTEQPATGSASAAMLVAFLEPLKALRAFQRAEARAESLAPLEVERDLTQLRDERERVLERMLRRRARLGEVLAADERRIRGKHQPTVSLAPEPVAEDPLATDQRSVKEKYAKLKTRADAEAEFQDYLDAAESALASRLGARRGRARMNELRSRLGFDPLDELEDEVMERGHERGREVGHDGGTDER